MVERSSYIGIQMGCITSLLIAFQDFLVSGVSVQVSGLAISDTLNLTPETRWRGFRSKINKLMRENHFNKSVMLPSNVFALSFERSVRSELFTKPSKSDFLRNRQPLKH